MLPFENTKFLHQLILEIFSFLSVGRPHLLPVIGHSNTSGNAWKLDQHTLTFALKGNLPFDKVSGTLIRLNAVHYNTDVWHNGWAKSWLKQSQIILKLKTVVEVMENTRKEIFKHQRILHSSHIVMHMA